MLYHNGAIVMKQDEQLSHLFTLRLWLEFLDEERIEIRGLAKHVRTGSRCTIRDWATLQAFLINQLGGVSANTHDLADDTTTSGELI